MKPLSFFPKPISVGFLFFVLATERILTVYTVTQPSKYSLLSDPLFFSTRGQDVRLSDVPSCMRWKERQLSPQALGKIKGDTACEIALWAMRALAGKDGCCGPLSWRPGLPG